MLPNYYPTSTIKVNGKEIEIEPYRVIEIRDYITPLDKITAKLSGIISKLEYYTGATIDDPSLPIVPTKDLSLEDIDKMAELGEEAVDLKLQAMELSYKVAQLGLKRALYKEAYTKVGKELDEFKDIGVTESQTQIVTRLMMKLANQDMPMVADTKNRLKDKREKKRSGK
ncbi:hypothetical protein [Methanobacterium spitsbergense]|uniref:Uncharacterized protein n=1 Tax=Methanobacterium spitsbergense TaxID=2874285 RepID=A0A8T5USI5_9EURY|nr:hypothetical protein [Methanobacterium spitsbergense]MBZ2167012.1 hypothetical protein [Methanobacterium spitsbergense]